MLDPKNGPDSRPTGLGLFFCYWHPEIVKNRRVRCELRRTPFEGSPPSGIYLIGSVNTRAFVATNSRIVGPEGIRVPRCGLVPGRRLVENDLGGWHRFWMGYGQD